MVPVETTETNRVSTVSERKLYDDLLELKIDRETLSEQVNFLEKTILGRDEKIKELQDRQQQDHQELLTLKARLRVRILAITELELEDTK